MTDRLRTLDEFHASYVLPRGFAAISTTSPRAICPDLLSIRDIGTADGWRGHLVRGFFRLLKVATGV